MSAAPPTAQELKVTTREMILPSFEDVAQASSDAAEHFAKAMQDCMRQREDILEEHGKQEVGAALALLQRSLAEFEQVAAGGANGESWKARVLDDYWEALLQHQRKVRKANARRLQGTFASS